LDNKLYALAYVAPAVDGPISAYNIDTPGAGGAPVVNHVTVNDFDLAPDGKHFAYTRASGGYGIANASGTAHDMSDRVEPIGWWTSSAFMFYRFPSNYTYWNDITSDPSYDWGIYLANLPE
jgi:hypothetical protein